MNLLFCGYLVIVVFELVVTCVGVCCLLWVCCFDLDLYCLCRIWILDL